jgi:hypothetical protein
MDSLLVPSELALPLRAYLDARDGCLGLSTVWLGDSYKDLRKWADSKAAALSSLALCDGSNVHWCWCEGTRRNTYRQGVKGVIVARCSEGHACERVVLCRSAAILAVGFAAQAVYAARVGRSLKFTGTVSVPEIMNYLRDYMHVFTGRHRGAVSEAAVHEFMSHDGQVLRAVEERARNTAAACANQ